MTLYCRPIGSGNWALATFKVSGRRMSPLLFKVGDRFDFAGVTWRVVRIEA